MRKRKQPFGDRWFYGDIDGQIFRWQMSPVSAFGGKQRMPAGAETFSAATIPEWHTAQINDEGQLDLTMSAHSMVWLRTFVYAPSAKQVFLEIVFDYWDDTALKYEPFVNGHKAFMPPTTLFMSLPFPGIWIQLRQGWNELAIKITERRGETVKPSLEARIIDKSGVVFGSECFALTAGAAPAKVALPPVSKRTHLRAERVLKSSANLKYHENEQDLTAERLAEFKTGIGPANIKSAGRFGFAKGDGMLDCSMPLLGLIAKPYLFGHPQYRKSMLWHFGILPPGIPEKDQYIGETSWDIHIPGDKEKLDVNWISVVWRKQLLTKSDFYHRRSGKSVDFACSYSIASPGILVETNDAALRLGGMESAGSYDYIALPLQKGRTIRPTHDGVVYDRQRDGAFTDNWILLWGADSFPDVPLMLALQKNPDKIVFNRNEDQILVSVDIVAAAEFGLAALVFPFGFEVFKPEETGSDAWIEKAFAKCAFFSRAVLAYPSDCQEYFKIVPEENRIEIIQKFDYRIISDEWGSKPLRTAPLPPPLSLLEGMEQFKLDDAAEDFGFPTKYGHLRGVIGRNWSVYSLPLPPTRRKFCLKPSGDESIAPLIGADFDEYLRFHRSSDIIANPGAYQFIIQYALPLALFNFLDEGNRKTLEKITGEGVQKGASPATEYTHTSGKRCCAWYKRTEPYTGVNYLMTYLHVGGIGNFKSCEREAIESTTKTFYEVDWGNGFALYSLYLGALLSGNWASIKANWKTIRHAFDYFLVLQDWACMATAYAEKGVTWNDGTNYGGYLGFIRMAEILGEDEARDLGLYAFAKLGAMRLGQFRAPQQYYPRFWGGAPWFGAKFFQEETDPGLAFVNVSAAEMTGQYRVQGIYNMTTEGHYPEAWEWYGRMMPAEIKKILASVNSSYGDIFAALPKGVALTYHPTGSDLGQQERFSYLMLALFSGFQSREKLLALLESASANHLLSEQYLGSSLSHRRVPAKWAYCFLKSQIQAHAFPAWLTGWYGTRIEAAEYDSSRNLAAIRLADSRKDGWIELGIERPPLDIVADGVKISGQNVESGARLLKIKVHGIKTLQIIFKNENDLK